MELVELITKEDHERSFETMVELVDHLTKEDYIYLLNEMVNDGYRLFALQDKEKQILSLAGIAYRTDFFNGKHMWVYELVTPQHARSKGYGKMLMEMLERHAKSEGCQKTVLYSGISRKEAHHFWENHMNYERRGIVFKKEI